MTQEFNNMSAALSPFVSGTNSPAPGGASGYPQQGSSGPSNQQMPPSMALAAAFQAAQSGQATPALAYANAQLSQYAHQPNLSPQMPRSQANGFAGSSGMGPPQPQQGFAGDQAVNQQLMHLLSQQGSIPPHLHPHALSAALAEYNTQSMPNSPASSPGQQYRRIPGMASGYPSGTMTGHNTPGGNSRIAASVITGKRLNWSEMICQTIAESESGRLVIQDLFDQMCQKFPEIHEWAFGKDWEARVKNRIKSTLSIKGNLFVKVPRPTSASGKGSWWTLSQEAQDAWKEGRMSFIAKSAAHSRNPSQIRAGFEGLSMSAATSRANSRAPSRRGSPVSSRGPASQHAQHHNQHAQNRPSMNYVNFGQDNLAQSSPNQGPFNHPSNSSSGGSGSGGSDSRRQSPSMGLPANLGMSPINFNVPPSIDSSFNFGMPGYDASGDASGNEPFFHGGFGDESKDSEPFASMTMPSSQGGMSYLPSANTSNSFTDMNMSRFNNGQMPAPQSGSTPRSDFGGLSMAAHMGGPQSMPFPPNDPPASNGGHGFVGGNNYTSQPAEYGALNQFSSDPTLGALAGLDLSGMDGLNNPFGSMAGGYTLLGESNGSDAQPTPIPGRNSTGASGNGSGQGNSGSGGRNTPSATSFNAAAWFGGPSPADSTGSTSQFFAYTPAMNAADAAVGSTSINSFTGSGNGSALGPVGGEGSRKRRDTTNNASQPGDFQLPPAADGNQNQNGGTEQRK